LLFLPALSRPGRPRSRWTARLLGLVVLLTGAVCGDDELDDLTRRLRQRDKWERKAAIEGLARLGTPPAWELVIEALAD